MSCSQELVAYGVCNSVASMFNCYVSAASLSRSLVQEGVGGQTQVNKNSLYMTTILRHNGHET